MAGDRQGGLRETPRQSLLFPLARCRGADDGAVLIPLFPVFHRRYGDHGRHRPQSFTGYLTFR
ncbi:hypothetical protein HVPorG_04271 [Roseomonas mucosa]|nr:hypothetical protein HVIM_04271 [Roseomonas mucosa]QDE00258.1 hypothetical protein ADP8_04271 [Roseomonas mucosa]QDJ10190.1 hypothetical protein HVPorG_04271 [Roseomonas mucosa]UZO92554.1 hypothetical protein RMP42_04271 [Roseomonas mucosa]UZO97526.1 hypothetical protein RMHFA_04271 [Roseomonas mucosa]